MNIRRGLFRTWVVGTGLWLLIVSAFVYKDIWDPWVEGRGFYFLKDFTKAIERADIDKATSATQENWHTYEIMTPSGFVYTIPGISEKDAYNRIVASLGQASTYMDTPSSAPRYSTEYKRLSEAVSLGHAQKVEIEGARDFMLFYESGTPKGEVERQLASIQPLALRIRSLVASAKRNESITYGSMAAVVPPIILFVFGWLLLWIARGFRG